MSKLIIVSIGMVAMWIRFALVQRRNSKWLTYEGKINSYLQGGRTTNPLTRVLMMHPYWDRIYGTIVDVKLEQQGNITVYKPIFRYSWLGNEYIHSAYCENERKYFNYPYAGKIYDRKTAYYEYNKYPAGKCVMLLIPEGHPEEIYILEDVLKVDIKGIFIMGITVVLCIALSIYLA